MEENKNAVPASPINNERLHAVFAELAKDNSPENKNKMIDEIVMRAKFFVPVIIEPKDGVQTPDGKIGKEDKVKFYTITNNEKKKYLMGFTSLPELAKWKKDGNQQQTLIFGFDNYALMLSQTAKEHAGWVIDPFGANVVLPTELVMTLVEEKKRRMEMLKSAAPQQEQIPAGTEIRLAQPKNYPIAMVKSITKYMKQHEEIKSGYLQLMLRENRESFLIIVDSEKEDNALFDGIIAAAREQNPPIPIELVWKTNGFGKQATTNVAPFYIK